MTLEASTAGQSSSTWWATVTSISPLRVRRDGYLDDLAISPQSLVPDLAVGDRVLCQRHFWSVVILGSAGSSRVLYLDAQIYGVSATNSDNRAALVSALTEAVARGAALRLPPGTLAVTGDLVVDQDHLDISGHGDATRLAFTGGGLIVDGSSSAYASRWSIRDLRITRAGTAGPALHFRGGGSGTGVIRWYVSNVHVEASTGHGLLIEGSYIGSFHGCHWRGCVTGVEIRPETVTGVVSGNLISFHGGEIQGNTNAMAMTGVAGVWLYGVGIEGNTSTGLNIGANPRNVGVYGSYFEGNGGYDIRIGSAATTGKVITVHNSYFADAGKGKTYSILVERGLGVDLDGLNFNGYGTNVPVLVQEAAVNQVSGRVGDLQTNGTAPVIDYGSNRLLKNKYSMRVAATLSYSAIAAGGSATTTVTVTGASVGDDAQVATVGQGPAGALVYRAWVSAADTVTVQCINAGTSTTGTLSVSASVRVWR